MFKKIEIWILYLTILIGILFALGFGVLVRQELEGMTKSGNIDISFLTKPAAYIARLPEYLLFAYLRDPNRVSDSWRSDRPFFNQDGFLGDKSIDEKYLLLSRYDGDLREGLVDLVDLRTFEVIHTWNPDINYLNSLVEKKDEFGNIERDDDNSRKRIMHPLLTSDGGLIFGWNSPIRKIDSCSNLIFDNSKDMFHHSIESDIEGNTWVPSHMYPTKIPIEKVGTLKVNKIGKNDIFLDDAIVKLSPKGEILYEKSIPEMFIENDLEYLLFSVGDRLFDYDPIHLNDIQPVDFDGKFWKKGDIFLSLRHQSMVLLYRPSTNKIIWKGTGKYFHQHDVDILDDSRIAVFNNNSKDFVGGDIVDGFNEVVIYDFETDEYSYYLPQSLEENDVRTVTEGRSEILPNGDLMIEETNYGRTLYFNADGTLRWTHVNRAKNGEVYYVGWSRLLYKDLDIKSVKYFLNSRGVCNE